MSLPRVLEAIIHSQVIMALSAVALLWSCAALMGLSLPRPIFLSGFLVVWSIYLGDSGLGISQEDKISHPERVQFYEERPWLVWLLMPLTFVVGCLLLLPFIFHLQSILLAGVLGFMALAYILPIIPEKGLRGFQRMKDIRGAKTHAVAVVWTFGSIGVPLAFSRETTSIDSPHFIMLTLVVYLLLFFDTLMLDWIDIEGDEIRAIRTEAVLLGDLTSPVLKWSASMILIVSIFYTTLRSDDLAFALPILAMSLIWWCAVIMRTRVWLPDWISALLICSWRFFGAAILMLLN